MQAAIGADARRQLIGHGSSPATSTPAPMPRWGPTVANRVPVHASGPYSIAELPRRDAAPSTPTACRAGAFRGFGVPQATIAQETALRRAGRQARHRPARIPLAERAAATAADGDRPGARRRRRHRRCLEALRPHWRARAAEASAFNAAATDTAGAASASPACGMAAATPRCPTRRPSASASQPDGTSGAAPGRRRYRPGLEHGHHPDLRRCARRCRWSASADDRRHRPHPRLPARPRPRARPSSPARRPKRPAAPCAHRSCASPMSRRQGRRSRSTARLIVITRGRRPCAASISPRLPRMPTASCFARRGDLRSADHCRSTPRARASPMRSMAMARRSPSSRSISSSAR